MNKVTVSTRFTTPRTASTHSQNPGTTPATSTSKKSAATADFSTRVEKTQTTPSKGLGD